MLASLHCWLIVNWTLKNKPQWNWNQNTKLFIHKNAFEKIVCEMAAILSRRRWVNVCLSIPPPCSILSSHPPTSSTQSFNSYNASSAGSLPPYNYSSSNRGGLPGNGYYGNSKSTHSYRSTSKPAYIEQVRSSWFWLGLGWYINGLAQLKTTVTPEPVSI